ncbi:DNA-binding response regulator, OmpR family, contains REC and winged-helix (wHTH) domain [Paenibacillus algorifonticola]|uniref:DNA-binding response regulator, OmpR family, contains REC and winged-helix (WHTH) domain n=1 Tax=Paenibacillus algorifonticola TaxID=684063 RepID=A0A1I2CSQ7_9BACL|nr:response regulator transcription factor [Paenibacillus algorifonticola]SFE71377.1 DNA-binding response regulator, OmpR family, contains REC and winged-helix (wHTH) domain [Paenibacillus algorifonticola]
MNRILLVEDDANFAFGIEYTLISEGYSVVVANTLSDARRELGSSAVNLILLDVNLPDGTGYEWCREIRASSQIPIIFLTALDEEANIVAGLDLGADDYMSKPIRTKELLSRMKAVLRRNQREKEDTDVLASGSIQVRVLEGTVLKNNRELTLTGLEYRLLLLFMKHPKQILTRTAILESLWDMGGEFVDDNTLSVHIRRLREKVEDDPAVPAYIVTVRGVGYKWNAEGAAR